MICNKKCGFVSFCCRKHCYEIKIYIIFASSIDFREKSALFLFSIFTVSTDSVPYHHSIIVMASSSKKRKSFSLTDKVKIIEAYDLEMKKSGKVCMTKFSEQTGIPRTTLNSMMKNRKKTEETKLAGTSGKMKKIRICPNKAFNDLPKHFSLFSIIMVMMCTSIH